VGFYTLRVGEDWTGLDPKRRRLVTALLAACLGALFMCCLGGWEGAKAFGISHRGVTTTATVVGVRHHAKGSPDVTVQFVASDGHMVTTLCRGCASDLYEGDTVRIRYDARFPDAEVENPDARVSRRIAILGGSVALAFLTAAGVLAWLLVRENRRRKFIQSAW
jgi:hypothetical protein